MSDPSQTTRSRYHAIEAAQRIEVGRKVLAKLGDIAPRKSEWTEDMWHELVGQEVMKIVRAATNG